MLNIINHHGRNSKPQWDRYHLTLVKVTIMDILLFWPGLFSLITLLQTWWTFPKSVGLSVRSMASTNVTKWHSTRRARILCMPRESSVMTGSRVTMVGRLSRFSRKRLKLQCRLYSGLNALSPTADLRERWLLRDTSVLN